MEKEPRYLVPIACVFDTGVLIPVVKFAQSATRKEYLDHT
ncbi:hypothetical protein F442_22327 [Phytophthora nicotianae P10297]|uniref:Uncharacterized protein n=1 Tax=Phytophthora nicotianae P10297 TaxID=1317064 RepID=W2XZU9_PHYNI|nr:hypothetical protein F442_22327 [Phytophthora nicotianae P10297]